MNDKKKEPKPKPIIKVCPKCNAAYKNDLKGCQSCGCELMDKCPSCNEPFDNVNPRRKVKYCPQGPIEIIDPIAVETLRDLGLLSEEKDTNPEG